MIDCRLRRLLVIGAALVAAPAISIGIAHATVGQAADDSFDAQIAACGRLPLSERGMCKSEVVANSGQFNAEPATSDVVREDHAAWEARFERALAECRRLPLSERGICRSNAGLDQMRR